MTQRYTLHDKSASEGKQQAALDQILDDMRRGEIRVLVVWHSDRIDRREVWRALKFIADVRDAGGRIESTEKGLLDENNLTTIIDAHMNREKIVHLSRQVGLAHQRIRDNGAAHGRAPWGMEVTGPKYEKRFTGTDEGRTWVPRIFARVIRGDSLAKISLWLQSEGIEGDHGPWHESTIGGMIRNPAYMGHRCQQDPKTKRYGAIMSQCDALVDATTWRKANESLDRRPKRGHTDPETRAMLSGGVLKCGNPDCDATGAPDSPMNRSTSGSRQYYRCCGTGAVRRSCGEMVRLEAANDAVDAIIAESFDTPRYVRKVIPGTDHVAELESLQFELDHLPARHLPRRDEQAERERLWAEQDRVAALPVVPDREVLADSGETYAGLWKSTGIPERGPWLVSQGFTVRALKTAVTVSQAATGSSVTMIL